AIADNVASLYETLAAWRHAGLGDHPAHEVPEEVLETEAATLYESVDVTFAPRASTTDPDLLARLTVPHMSGWSQTRLGPEGIRQEIPWLSKINPLYAKGADFLTNCLLTGIGLHLTLEEMRLHPERDPARQAYYQVPPEAAAPYEHLANLDRGDP